MLTMMKLITLPVNTENMSSGQLVFYWAGAGSLVVLAVCVPVFAVWLTYLLWSEPSRLTFQGKIILEMVTLGVSLIGLMVGGSIVNHLFRLAEEWSGTVIQAYFHLVAAVAIAVGGTAFLYNIIGG